MERVPSLDELKKLRVVDLKERLSSLGLPQGGLKADLVARLHSALVAQAKSTDEDMEEEFAEDEGDVDDSGDYASQSSPLALNYTDDSAEQRREEEQARLLLQEEERRRQNEMIRLARKQEEEERLRLESLRVEEMERQRLEEEERLRVQLEAEAQRVRLEEERRRQEEEMQRVRLAEERRRQEAEMQRLMAEEEERRQQEEEAMRLKFEEEKRQHEERLRLKVEEERRQHEEKLRARAEEEKRQREAEELKARLEEERQQKEAELRVRLEQEQKKQEEELRVKLEEERRQREEEERQQQEEEEMLRQKLMEEKRQKEEEALRVRLEEERRRKEEEERRQREEEEARHQELEKLRLKLEEEKRCKEEEELRQRLEEERMQREEQLRIEKEEEKRKREEALRVQREEEEKRRQEEALRLQEEEKRKQELLRQQKDEEENRRKQEILLLQQEEAKRKEAALFRLQQGALIEQKKEEEEKRIQQQTLILHQQQEENMMREQIKLLGAERQAHEGEMLQHHHQIQATATTQHIISITSTSQQQLQPVIVSPAVATTTNVTVVPVIQAPSIQTMVVPLVTAVAPTTLVTQTIVHAPQATATLNHPTVMVVPRPPLVPTPAFDGVLPNQARIPPPVAFVSGGADEQPPGLAAEAEYVVPPALERVFALGTGDSANTSGARRILGPQRPPQSQTDKDRETLPSVGMDVTDTTAKTNSQEPNKEPKQSQSKNMKRKAKKKKRRARNRELTVRTEYMDDEATEPDVEVEYVQASLDMDINDPMYSHFMSIFEAFKLTDPDQKADEKKPEEKKEPDLRKKPKDADEELEEEPKKDEHQKLSKRKLKKLSRLSVAELKQHVSRPDVVEMHDVTAKDPRVLVLLKAYRNTVPVPRHWCFKRKYLQGKRGIEKPPFDLPDFIKKTGIMEMRQALIDKEGHMTMKAKMRERVRPTMGKIDIDYQKLHDAFFKWQTKPRMTIHGDLYYEGKEFETRLKEKKPGDLSDELRTALGMPVGPNAQKVPPPWLIAMQRYGPPPSYPNLKIPGLNAPIPDSCSFGYHAGGWGKPPVDEGGRPLYGDVFGTQGYDYQTPHMEEEVDRTLWGELESESESESELEEESEEEEEEEPDRGGLMTPAEGGLVTPSGLTSIPTGMETPDMIELRKRKIETDMEGVDTPALYTVLPEKRTDRVGMAMMGSTHVYDVNAAIPAARNRTFGSAMEAGVEVTLDPSELDMDSAAMAARYEQTLREQNQLAKEDLSDMVAEHAAKQKHKRKRQQQQDTGKSAKKYKDFKF